jgi:DNA modification methylase
LEPIDREKFRNAVKTVLLKTSKSKNRKQQAFGFYWTRKNIELARTLIENYSSVNSVVLDPFMGSGTTILGSLETHAKRLAVGVELNELPIRNLQATTGYFDLAVVQDLEKLKSAIDEISALYKFELNAGNVKINKIIHDKSGDVLRPKTFLGILNGKKIEISDLTDPQTFVEMSKLYFERITQLHKRTSQKLEQNSRIAIKPNMQISDMFGPLGFEALERVRECAPESIAFKLALGSSIHLCRLTDLKSQSQFPYWYPKNNICEKSVYEILIKKFSELTSLVSPNESKTKHHMFENYAEWSATQQNGMLLLHGSTAELGKLGIPEKSVDLVITDPPYFDQVAYSEYLKLWEYFTGYKSDLDREIVESSRIGANKTREAFLSELQLAFIEIRNSMKDNAYAFVYFKDSKPRNLHDFINCLENSGLKYIFQIHLETASFTYKQNSSPENTVGGDSIMVFEAVPKRAGPATQSYQITSKVEFETVFTEQFSEYLLQNGPSTLTEALDNSLIASLYPTGYLKNITSSGYLGSIVSKQFTFDKSTRKWAIEK